MNSRRDDCERVSELGNRAAAGTLSSEEGDFIDNHLARCAECRLVAEAEGMLGLGHLDVDPHLPVDELADRRLVEEVLARHTGERGLTGDVADSSSARTGRLWIAGVLSAAAAAAIALVVWYSAAPVEPGAIEVEPAVRIASREPAPAKTPTVARVALLAGEGSCEGEPLGFGQEIAAGTEVHLEAGEAVLALPEGVNLLLSGESELEIARLDAREQRISLKTGRVLASVTPGERRSTVIVETAAGQVVVTGTIFSVEAVAKTTAVAVLRGIVRLEGVDGERMNLTAGRRAVFGEAGDAALDAAEEQREWSRIKRLDLLAVDRAAEMSVSTVPPGALVSVDGSQLGRTPLSAGLRNGHRDLSVTLDGYTGVNERIQLGEDERLRRVFELDRVHGEKLETDDRQQPPSTRPRGETRSSAAELLVVAQERRMAQDWPGAARSYREIIEAFPQSREAASASVSLGGIELRQLGQPARALGSFQRYLKAHPRDGLAPEALFGKAQALRALRREVEERAALAAFLRKFPSAVQVPRVRARLDAIR